MEIVLLIAGSILGVIVDRLYRVGHAKVVERRIKASLARRAQGSEVRAVTDWLLSYYGHEAGLYECTISGVKQTVPFFVDSEWVYCRPLADAGSLLREVPADDVAFRVDQRLIAMRATGGQRLFNNLTFYTSAVRTDGQEPPLIEIAQTEYYAVISNLIALEEEVFRAVLSGSRRAPIRARYLSDLSRASQFGLRPLSFGVNVGLVLRLETGPKIIIQTRSTSTVTYGGSKATFPSFGLAPIGYDRISSEELLYLNFVKEYLEEFYSYDDLIDALSQRRTNPRWFMELPEAIEINQARADQSLAITLLGFGMDCLSGTTTVAMLVELKDQRLAHKIMRDVVGNWEVAEASLAGPSLEAIDVFSDRLGSYLANRQLHTGSAFTLDRIQEYYRSVGLA